ncbi:hypothetical protein, partial [Paenibacillus lactis]|uniref:hypothetical protein n=1 Tax=Paenibacillus lactis TaxID=228574 RepID=UPI0036A44811
HLKTSPNWGEVPFLCLKILVYQGLRLMQNAHLYRARFPGYGSCLVFLGLSSSEFPSYCEDIAKVR